MKKALILATFTLFTLFSQAQHGRKVVRNTSPQASFGIKGGLNIANLQIENSSNLSTLPSFNVGGFAHIHVSNDVALQPEVLFSGQGAKQTVANIEYKYKLNYVIVPVLLQYMFSSGFRLETGPQVGFLVSAKQKAGSIESDLKSNFKKVDFGWVFGIGYLTSSKIGFDARYNAGISDIHDSGPNKVHNRVFAFGVFYQFD